MKKEIITKNAPKAIGPYSQGIEVGNMIYLSGQIPINTVTGDIAIGIEKQTKQVLENIKALLESKLMGMDSVVKTTIFLSDMNNFSKVNEIYSSYFESPYPARSTVEVSRLPKDVLIEIETIAVLNR